jgi:hypothetical protein
VSKSHVDLAYGFEKALGFKCITPPRKPIGGQVEYKHGVRCSVRGVIEVTQEFFADL